jgi:C4-dicarboxylate transporter DctQ subunit
MISRAFDRAEDLLTAALLAAMTLLTFTQVVLRYVFNSGLVWALEATVYLFGWLVLLGLSGTLRTNSHIAVDFVTKRLTAKGQKAVALLAMAFALLYAALMLYGSISLVTRLQVFGSMAHDLPLPRWVLLASLPIGFALLGVRLLQATVAIVRGTQGTAPEQHAGSLFGSGRQAP